MMKWFYIRYKVVGGAHAEEAIVVAPSHADAISRLCDRLTSGTYELEWVDCRLFSGLVVG